MKKLFLLVLITTFYTNAQTPKATLNIAGFGAGFNTGTIAPSSIFEATSTTKGVLVPRMTTIQRNAISSPATSLIIYNTTTGKINYYTGGVWEELGVPNTAITGGTAETGDIIQFTSN